MHTTPIYDITSFTALDYPEHLAAIFWFAGCNMHCSYCYNPDIVLGKGRLSVESALSFLESRRGLIEGVVLSGGEATLYPELPALCQQIKALGFKIKLDTNGVNPQSLLVLIEEGLLDYVALDYKAPKQKFQEITRNKHFDHFSASLNLLIQSGVPFEARTTVCNDLLTEEDINHIMTDLYKRGYRAAYYLQHYIEDTPHLGRMKKQMQTFDANKLSDRLEVIWR
jgi:pyruvate formate lyase activating enzyme